MVSIMYGHLHDIKQILHFDTEGKWDLPLFCLVVGGGWAGGGGERGGPPGHCLLTVAPQRPSLPTKLHKP